MKRLRYAQAALAAVCLVALAGCAALEGGAEKVRTLKSHVTTLKEKGCDAVPGSAKRLMVVLIKSRIPDYPPNGICDPDWVRDVLVERLPDLEAVSDESAVYIGSEDLGYSTDSGGGSLVESGGAEVLFSDSGPGDIGAGWVSDRSGIHSSVGAFIHASSLEAYSSGSGHSRLLLHASLQQHEQVAGGSDLDGGNGACNDPGSKVAAAGSLVGCSSGWSGRLVA